MVHTDLSFYFAVLFVVLLIIFLLSCPGSGKFYQQCSLAHIFNLLFVPTLFSGLINPLSASLAVMWTLLLL